MKSPMIVVTSDMRISAEMNKASGYPIPLLRLYVIISSVDLI